MINIRKLKPIKTNFPIMIAEKAISKITCKNLVKEIQKLNSLKRRCFRHFMTQIIQ